MAKRIGWARIKALINENVGTGLGTHRNWVLQASGSNAGVAQAPTTLVVGTNLDSSAKPAIVNPFAESSTKLWEFGTLLHYGDRVFRYAGIGGVAVTAGKTLQTAAAISTHRDLAVQAAAAAGARTVSVTLGGTNAVTANQYAEGYIHINDVAGQGQLLRIKSHAAAAHSTTLTLTLHDAVVTALTTSSKADLIASAYNDLVVAPTTFTGPVVGVTAMDMSENEFGWVQIAGPCSVLFDTNGAGGQTGELGDVVYRSDEVAGAAFGGGTAAGSADRDHQQIGTVMAINGDTDYNVVWLNHL